LLRLPRGISTTISTTRGKSWACDVVMSRRYGTSVAVVRAHAQSGGSAGDDAAIAPHHAARQSL
jgi:hypothetical protein